MGGILLHLKMINTIKVMREGRLILSLLSESLATGCKVLLCQEPCIVPLGMASHS